MAAISIRSLDDDTVEAFNRSARARGMSQAEYLGALVELHAACRQAIHEWLAEYEDPKASAGQVLFDRMKELDLLAVEV